MLPWDEPRAVRLRLAQTFDHAPGWSWRPPARPHHNLWIALEGEAVFSRHGMEFTVGAGSAFLLRPDDDVRCETRPRKRFVNFAAHLLGDEEFARRAEPFCALERPARLPPSGWLAPFCRHLTELYFLDPGTHHARLMQGLGVLLLSMQAESQSAPMPAEDQRILRLIERIRVDPARRYAVPEMAERVGLSSSQFTRRFRALTGVPPARFVIEQRLDRAEAYLAESDLTIGEIAERTGYSDLYFFSRQYRRFRGAAPSTRRRRTT